ncbi:MAG: hypothetical protein IPN60_09615 [Saprospiraceae bacterium]|nr:hypothetical protein [Candidatus Opimibacter skivensis]
MAPAIISLKVFKKNNVELAVVVGGDTNNGFAGYSAAGLVSSPPAGIAVAAGMVSSPPA